MITSSVLERNHRTVCQYSLHQTDLTHLHNAKSVPLESQIHTSSTVPLSSSICEAVSNPSLLAAVLQP